jgi:ribonuclease HII
VPRARTSPRTAPTDLERKEWDRGLKYIVGLDEVGMGPLAGPVVAAAVVLKPGQLLEGVYDSKSITKARREELAGLIRSEVLSYGIAAASTREIERLNIRRAAALAMLRAVRRLPFDPELMLVDGFRVPELGDNQRPIVKGDRLCHSIACASILAKVVRDRLMVRLSARYPVYGWADNKGYASRAHLDAIEEHGPSPHHRGTYSPVVQTRLALD